MKIVKKQLSNLHVSKIKPFQPTCLIKQAICTPPLVMFRRPRTWRTFWSTKFWIFWVSFCYVRVVFIHPDIQGISVLSDILQLLRDFFVMHEVLQLLMWYFLPVIWLLNLIVACHHFLAAFTWFVVTFIAAGVCWGGVLQPTWNQHCGGSTSERDQEDPQEQHKVENTETFRTSNAM